MADSVQAQTTTRETDVVIIGGGPTGENVAQYVVEGGLSAVLVESELVGGECSYYACMPSKALLRPLEVLGAASQLGGIAGAHLDPSGLLLRRDEWVSNYDDSGQEEWARQAGIDVVRGHGRLVAEKSVAVDGARGSCLLRARRAVVLATGSVPVVPGNLAALEPWDSRDATAVQETPKRLLIVGGGVVAVEAATWMAALGSEVTLLARGALLGSAEPFAGSLVAEGLRARGVRIHTRTSVRSATRDVIGTPALGRVHGGEVVVHTETEAEDRARGSVSHTFTVDEVLVATGRRPRVDEVGLEALGLTTHDVATGRLPEWLHAIGDAGPHASLTHMGKYEARVLGARLVAGPSQAPPVVPVPQVVFTDPQVAWVGLTQSRAERQGFDVVTAQVPYTAAAGGALLRNDAHGSTKLVVHRTSGLVLGATFVGPSAAELLHAATIAIVGEVPVRLLRHAVPAYPTASELWLRLLEELPQHLR